MYVIKEDEEEFTVVETNLYKFYKTHGDFRIDLFSPIVGKMDQTLFLDNQRVVADQLRKKFTIVRE
ncbi:hypothetical protein D3C87_2117970 [compost metagenome]